MVLAKHPLDAPKRASPAGNSFWQRLVSQAMSNCSHGALLHFRPPSLEGLLLARSTPPSNSLVFKQLVHTSRAGNPFCQAALVSAGCRAHWTKCQRPHKTMLLLLLGLSDAPKKSLGSSWFMLKPSQDLRQRLLKDAPNSRDTCR